MSFASISEYFPIFIGNIFFCVVEVKLYKDIKATSLLLKGFLFAVYSSYLSIIPAVNFKSMNPISANTDYK